MTCTHVLALIDAVPFVDYPRAHLDIAWQHARECATCGPPLARLTALTTGLVALPLPAPSSGFAATVLARIARVEETQPAQAAAAEPPSITPDWSAWATALGSVAVGVVIFLSLAAGEAPLINMTSPVVRAMTWWVARPTISIHALVLAAGLLLYAAGLFGSITRPSRW